MPEPRYDGRRPEPRWMTLADLGVMVAGIAVAMTIPSRGVGWPPYLAPPPLGYFVILGGLGLTAKFGLVLALVILARRGRYGGQVRPAEWLALGLASLCLLESIPNLDGAVNAYYVTAGSTALDFGVARWLLSAPAAAGVVVIVAGWFFLRRWSHDQSRAASALTVVGIVVGLCLCFWGPCEVARLELPWLVVPGLQGDPPSWGWRGPAVDALHAVVANTPTAFTWGILAAATVRTWWGDRHGGRSGGWVWTELAAFADAVVAFLMLTIATPQGPAGLVGLVSWLGSIGLVSWWVSGRLGIGHGL